MTRRPFVRIKLGETDYTVGYELRGDAWVVYEMIDGKVPSAVQQFRHETKRTAHKHFIDLVSEHLAAHKHLVSADESKQATHRILEEFDDTPT